MEKQKLPVGVGGVKLIDFGADYKAWPARRKIDYLEKLASSMNQAADLMQKERDRAFAAAANFEKQIEAASKLHDVQNATMVKQLNASNAQKQEFLQQIESLKAALKKAKLASGDIC